MTTPRTSRLNDRREQAIVADGLNRLTHPTASWWKAAYCLGADVETFFPPSRDHAAVQRALAICAQCPVRLPCRRYALNHPERHGIWGGLTEETRETLIRLGPTPVVRARTPANRKAFAASSNAGSPPRRHGGGLPK